MDIDGNSFAMVVELEKKIRMNNSTEDQCLQNTLGGG